MAFKVGQVTADVTADTSSFNRSMGMVRKQGASVANSVQGAFRNVGQRMQRLGTTLTRSLTLPMAAFGGATVKAFADFDSAMTQSIAIMDGVTSDVREEMENAARSISEQLTVSSTQAAESYFFLASAGLDAKQSIEALPQVAKFAQAGMFDMATATDLATDAQSALGLTVDDAVQNMRNLTRVTDVLVKANTLANASVQQFSEALTNRAAAAMRSANKEVEEGVAVLAAFADQGLKGQMAGEQFARILRILSQEAAKSRDLFTDLGIIDAQGNLNNMADIIEILTNEMQGLSDSQKSAKLEQLGFTARVQAAIKPLLGTADAIRQYEAGLRGAAGITDEVANKQLKSLTSEFQRTWNVIVNASQEIGQAIAEAFDLKGIVKSLRENVKNISAAFMAMSDESKRQIFGVAAALGAGGPLLVALGVAAKAVAGFAKFVRSRFAIITAAVVLGVTTIQWLSDNWNIEFNSMRDVLKKFANAVRNLFGVVGDAAVWLGSTIVSMFQTVGNFVISSFSKQEKAILGSLNVIQGAFGTTYDFMESALSGFSSSANDNYVSFSQSAKNAFENVSSYMQSFLNDISGGSLNEFLGLLDGFSSSTSNLNKRLSFMSDLLNGTLFPAFQTASSGTRGLQMDFQALTNMLNGQLIPTLNQVDEETKKTKDDTEDLGGQSGNVNRLASAFGGLAGNIAAGKKEALSFGSVLSSIIPAALSLIPGAGPFASFAGSLFGGFRAHGGPVSPGKGYVVGENGPELFMPKSSGQIVSNKQMSMGGTRKIHISLNGEFVQNGTDLRAVIDESKFVDLS